MKNKDKIKIPESWKEISEKEKEALPEGSTYFFHKGKYYIESKNSFDLKGVARVMVAFSSDGSYTIDTSHNNLSLNDLKSFVHKVKKEFITFKKSEKKEPQKYFG